MKKSRLNILIITELYPNVINTFIGTFVREQLIHLQTQCDITVISTHAIPLRKLFWLHQHSPISDSGIQKFSVAYYPFWLELLTALGLIHPNKALMLKKKLARKKMMRLSKKLHAKCNFDLVHGHESFIGDEAIPIAKQLRIPSVFTLHGVFSNHKAAFGETVMREIFKNLQQANQLISVSAYAAQTYSISELQKAHWKIIPNGVDLSLYATNRKITSRTGRLKLLSVGFFVPGKKFDHSIRVLAALRARGHDVELTLVGQGPLRKYYSGLAQELNVSEFLNFLGAIPPKKMPIIYNQHDILVHPSEIESFSMVCLEAMACNLPVLCTSTIGLAEFLQNGVDAIIVTPSNLQEVVDKLEQLIQNNALYSSVAKAGNKTAQAFSWKHVAQQIYNTYKETLYAKF